MTRTAPAEPWRLARVVTRLNVGGPSHHVRILSTRMGAWNGVLLAGAGEAREGSLEDVAVAAGADLRRVPGLRRPVAPLDDLRALWWLYRQFRRHRPVLVATHMAKAGTLGRLAAWLAGVPIRVHTFHGHVLEGYFSRPVTAFYRAVERFLGRRTTHFIAISPEIRDDLAGLGIASRNVTVVRLGLDLEGLADGDRSRLRSELGIPPEAPVVGIVGRLAPVKAHDLFLAAATRVALRVPAAHFAVVGDGELWDSLRNAAAATPIAERVHFTGWRRDLADVYAALDVVVCCSVNEGTPVSVIEAGAAGRPVVCTRVGGVPDVVEEGVNGLLVEPGDAGGLAAALVSIITDPELSGRLGAAGRALSMRRYGAERLVRDITAVYDGLLQQHQ